MFVDIGEGLLDDAEKHGFHERGKPMWAFAAECDLDSAALAEFFYEPFHGRVQSDLVQKRRMEQVRKSAGFAQAELDDILQILRSLLVDGRSVGDQSRQTHRHCGEILTHAVVPFAGQAALFILGAQ